MICEIKGNKKIINKTTIFVNETERAAEYFECCVLLTVKTYYLKVKLSAINGAFWKFKQQWDIRRKNDNYLSRR